MTRRLTAVVAAAVLAVTSPAALAVAQAPAPVPAPAHQTTTPAAGPTVAAATAGIRRAEVAKTVPAAAADTRLGAGRNVALMVVGGAALIIGAIIGGTAGVLIAVTGAAVGLYGLYNFIQ